MFPTQKNAKAKEVQDSAGHNTIQWNRFYVRCVLISLHMFCVNAYFGTQYLTKKEARILVQEDCDFRWPSIPANKKIALFERVKAQLAAEEIPEVRDDIMEWRMAHAVRDTRQNACKCFGHRQICTFLTVTANKAAMPTT
jgi:hypothetical protein